MHMYQKKQLTGKMEDGPQEVANTTTKIAIVDTNKKKEKNH
jgi:hypothetical protein